MQYESVIETMNRPISRELLESAIPARLAYTARDGFPRAVPIGCHWTGERLVMCTVPKAAKVAALRESPKVALTIDTEGFPPKALLVRGTAGLELVDGVPDEYLAGSHKLFDSEAQAAEFEAGVRALYRQMVRITVTPEWAKLLDFETTIPSAVEDLVRERAADAAG